MLELKKPIVISIAGNDPCAGAGLLADVKTIEANGCYAMGVATAITYQNDFAFDGLRWFSAKEIINQLRPIVNRYHCKVFKVGIISSLEILNNTIDFIQSSCNNSFIIWDPVLSASAGFNLIEKTNEEDLFRVLKKLSLITPNIPEIKQLMNNIDTEEAAKIMSDYCMVYLKGGHDNSTDCVNDYLFINGKRAEKFTKNRIENGNKHGSGCVLSSAIAANYAHSNTINYACHKANQYIQQFLSSSTHLIGYHQYAQ